MIVSLELTGNRGRKYFVRASQMGAEAGGGVLFELLDANGPKLRPLASSREPSDTISARLLSAWLAAPMPAEVKS